MFPKKSPNKMPSGTGDKSELKLTPSRETPALANANNWHNTKCDIWTDTMFYFY